MKTWKMWEEEGEDGVGEQEVKHEMDLWCLSLPKLTKRSENSNHPEKPRF
jgi:hypothetical protein